LLYGLTTVEDDFSLDVFILKVRSAMVIAEWEKHRSRLLDAWKHPSVMPYAEALSQAKKPDKKTLNELYQGEVKNGTNK